MVTVSKLRMFLPTISLAEITHHEDRRGASVVYPCGCKALVRGVIDPNVRLTFCGRHGEIEAVPVGGGS